MFRGFVTVEITGADIPLTLQTMTEEGITLLGSDYQDDLTVHLTITRQEFETCRKICEKRGDRIRKTGHQGAYWRLHGFRSRPVLLMGLLLVFCLSLYLPTRILFVHVEGNQRIPPRKILDTAYQCGIRFGASRRAVRSERMKNALLEAIPQLQWAGINTQGAVAVISVRERPVEESPSLSTGFGHIVALTDAMVTSCTATRGTLLCAEGQAVREGQILISGYTDTGLMIRAEEAQGEIWGSTMRKITAVTPSKLYHAVPTGVEKEKISILFGKKRINLWKDSGIWDTTCDRMYEEYYITLPGGFHLPVVLAVERFAVTEYRERELPETEGNALLSDFGESYLKQTVIAGMIRSAGHHYAMGDGIWILEGEYRCTELIGVLQRLQIGE